MLRTIIIDDEKKGIDTLKILIEKHLEAVKVVATSTRAAEGVKLIENYKPEIVFLDIHMPGMNGFELLEKLSWKNFSLIFTTAHQEYGLKALKLNAADYLLKPIDHRDLQFAVNKIKERLSNDPLAGLDYTGLLTAVNQVQQRKKIIVNSRSGIDSIDLPDIVYFESISNYTQIYLVNSQTILSSKTLREFDVQVCLPGQHFMRVHNSFIINLHKVVRYIKEQELIVMLNQQKIPVSKSRKESFFKWLDV